MKNKIAKAGLCVLAAGLLFTGSVYGAEQPHEYDDVAISSTNIAFWRKKDKDVVPGNETPNVSPTPSPNATPTGVPRDTPKASPQKAVPQTETPKAEPKSEPKASPVAAPKDAPKESPEVSPKANPPKETSDLNDESIDNEAALARYYQPSGQNQGNQGQQGQQQQNQNLNQQQNQHHQNLNQQNQQRQNSGQNQGQGQYQQNQSQYQNQQQNQRQTGGHYQQHNNTGTGQRYSGYIPGVCHEIHRLLGGQPSMQLDPDAYIVQREDGLWLVMGNIRAKLEILIYVDQKNTREAEIIHHGNVIPLYK